MIIQERTGFRRNRGITHIYHSRFIMTSMKHQRLSFLLLSVTVILFSVALRLVDLTGLPPFIDESIYVTWTHRMMAGEPFFPLSQSRWLFLAYAMPFDPAGPEALPLMRMLAITWSAVSTAAAIALGAMLAKPARLPRWVGPLTGLIYAIIPLALLHDRQALFEPMMNALAMSALAGSMRLARRPSPVLALIIGLLLAGAVLNKINAVPFLVMPPLAARLMSEDRKRAIPWGIGASAAALLIIGGVYGLARAGGVAPDDSFSASTGNTLLPLLASPEGQAKLMAQARQAWDVWWTYVTWPLMLLALFSLAALREKTARGPLIVTWIAALAFVPLPILLALPTSTGDLPARYFLFHAAPVAALAVTGVLMLARLTFPHRRAWPALAVILLAVVPVMRLDVTVLRDIETARDSGRLAEFDNLQFSPFLTGWSRDQVADAMLSGRDHADQRILVLLPEAERYHYGALLGPRAATVAVYQQGNTELAAQARAALDQGHAVYLIEQAGYPLDDGPLGLSVTPVLTTQYEDWAFTLYRAE